MKDENAARLLDVAVATLRDEILPHVSDPIARIKLDHVSRLLWSASARLSTREEGLHALLAALGSSASGDAEDGRRQAEAAICADLPRLLAAAGEESAALHTLQAIVASERAFYISQDPDVAQGSAVVYRGGRVESERPRAARLWPEIDAQSLTAYVRGREDRSDLCVGDVRRIPGGFSKETIFFALEDGEGGPQPLVIRKDLPVPLIEKTVVDEYPRIARLFALGFPVAEPLWIESDPALFGGAFLVSRRVAGTSDVASWSSDPARAAAACDAVARMLAQLHSYSPADVGASPADAALSAGAWMEREVAHWLRLFHAKRQEAFPLQELPLVWLRDNIPTALYDRPARLVHGDVGFHNLMFDDAGAITAVLDWEFSSLGDPTQDLCFVRQFIESLIPWDAFLARYRAAGGAEPCAEAEFFYRLWTKTRNAVGCVDAQALFDNVMPDEARFALAGHVFAPYMFIDQCETLLDHLAARQTVGA